MAGETLNDIVTDYAAANAAEATYNAGKALLQATYTFDQIMAAGSGDYNSGLAALASVTYETGDAILLDPASTGYLLIDSVSGTDKLLIDF